jgi:very-short-patch-repair endonuclease
MTKLYNQTSEKQKRQALRNNMPPAEKIVWAKLRSQQIESCKFRRQYSIDKFVIDFYSPELRLAIEIDGDSHYQDGAAEYDRERQEFLESKGTQVLRFTNQEVYQNMDGVVERIREVICGLREVTPLIKGRELNFLFSPLIKGRELNFLVSPLYKGGLRGVIPRYQEKIDLCVHRSL